MRYKTQITAETCIITLTAIAFVEGVMIDFNDTGYSDIGYENNIVDNKVEYDFEVDKKYGINPHWKIIDKLNKNSHKYFTVKSKNDASLETTTSYDNLSVIPIKYNDTFVKTTLPYYATTTRRTSEKENTARIDFNTESAVETSSTEIKDFVSTSTTRIETTQNPDEALPIDDFIKSTITIPELAEQTTYQNNETDLEVPTTVNPSESDNIEVTTGAVELIEDSKVIMDESPFEKIEQTTVEPIVTTTLKQSNSTNATVVAQIADVENDTGVPFFSELDYNIDSDVPEDYYDGKDEITTKAPNTDALSVIFGLAGSIAESVAERVLPKTIFDIYKRLQRQSEALEIERLRSPEENGGIGQFGRGLLKTLSSGLTRPLNQLMAGVRDIGSLDNDRSFVSGVASGVAGVADGVANVANSLSDAFKDRVLAIYPGTLWCGDGNAAKSRELGLFFLTDTCCRQHDACKMFIRAGETKYGLMNTGLFTRSHCSCDTAFKECLKKTNSLVSNQIGLTFFNVLGPQCFRKAHPIIKCVRRTRLTGQKCEQYELDYAKAKIWQWFDNETY